MTTSSNWDDILMRLENKTADTYSDNELLQRAAHEIAHLRYQVEDLQRRNDQLASRVVELMKELTAK
jgi:hypothetical protein